MDTDEGLGDVNKLEELNKQLDDKAKFLKEITSAYEAEIDRLIMKLKVKTNELERTTLYLAKSDQKIEYLKSKIRHKDKEFAKQFDDQKSQTNRTIKVHLDLIAKLKNEIDVLGKDNARNSLRMRSMEIAREKSNKKLNDTKIELKELQDKFTILEKVFDIKNVQLQTEIQNFIRKISSICYDENTLITA